MSLPALLKQMEDTGAQAVLDALGQLGVLKYNRDLMAYEFTENKLPKEVLDRKIDQNLMRF